MLLTVMGAFGLLALGAGTAWACLPQAQVAVSPDAAGAMQVVGHTDAVGDPAYNQQLSHARAQAVADHLDGELGLSGVDLTVEGRGENEPVAANETEDGEDNPEGRARNRRVELHFEAPDR